MERTIIRTDGTQDIVEVGDGFEAWNKAIGARTGEIVASPCGQVELWCDEEGLFTNEPQLNRAASLLTMRPIVGNVIMFYPGDIK